MSTSRSSVLNEPGRAGSPTGRLVWNPKARASRRQWWIGHLSALLLAGLGFLGGMGVMVSIAAELGLDQDGGVLKVLAGSVAMLCLAQLAIASSALSRGRLSERGEPHDLVDAFICLAGLEAVLMLNGAARLLTGGDWILPAAPQWLDTGVTIGFLGSLAALALECGVFERASLTEIWRGRKGEWRTASSE